MGAVLTILHVIVCVFLVAVVLLQRGRGAQVGAVFGGGGGGTMFGARGAGNFLTKLTTGAAIIFMLTSLSLSYLGLTGSGRASVRRGRDRGAGRGRAALPGARDGAARTERPGTRPEPDALAGCDSGRIRESTIFLDCAVAPVRYARRRSRAAVAELVDAPA